MSKVEERVVRMNFDNAQFERGVKQSITSLADLNKGLQMTGATKGLQDVNSAVDSMNLGKMAGTLDHIASRFSAMSVIAITALATIAHKAIETGTQLAKSLTIEPIKAGFDEYELKLGSIQTILANTQRYGTTLGEVTAALEELNTYADKTIYNFGDMTKNIGLFTNAGIRIEDATAMIKGFSNVAAASGTSAQGAAGAAYQLSQALSTGTIRLMDWRSLSNVGMGNKNMQEGIIGIAEAMGSFEGTTIGAKDAAEDFNGSLEKNWLSADVMSTYLKIMAGEMDATEMSAIGLSDTMIDTFIKQQKTAEEAATKVRTFTQLLSTVKESVGSGWSQTFEILVGNFDEATELWTGVNNAIGGFVNASADARNKVLGDWKELGGRTVLIEGIKNAFNALMDVIKPIKDAFREIFPAKTGADLFKLTESFRDFTEKLKIGSETAEQIGRIFKGVFAVFDIGWTIVKELAGAIFDLFGAIAGGGRAGGFMEMAADVGDFLVRLRDALKEGEGIKEFFETLSKVIAIPLQAIKELGKWIASLFDDVKGVDTGGLDRIGDRFKSLADLGGKIGEAWEKVAGFFKNVYKTLQPLLETIGKFFSEIGSKIADAFSGGNFSLALDAINTGLLAGAVLLLRKFVKNGFQFDVGGGFFGAIKDSFQELTGVFSAMQTQLKANALLKIGAAIALITLSVVALSLIDSDRLMAAIAALSVMFAQLLAAMAIFEKISGSKGFLKMPIVMASLILLAIAIDILTIAVAKLGKLDWNELAKGLLATVILIAALVLATKGIDKNAAGMIRSGAAMVIMAFAIKLLADSVKDLAEMSWEEMAQGLTGVALILGALGLFTKFAKVNKGGFASGAGLLLLAGGIYILGKALGEFVEFSWSEIARGLVAMAGGLGIMAAALALVPPSSIISAAAIFIVAASLGTIADAMKDMGGMKWGEIGKGLTVMAGALLAIGLALTLMPATSIISAAALFIAAAAIKILGQSLEGFGEMDWEEIGKSLVVLAGALTIISVALWAMTGALPGAAALVIVAGALAILTPILMALGSMSWGEILTGLGALALVFLVLAVAGAALTPVIPTLIGLGIAIGLLGIGLLAAGAGVLLFSLGFQALAAAFGSGIDVIVDGVKALLGLIPYALEQLGLGLIAFANVIATGGPAFTNAFKTLILSLLDAINEIAPQIVETLVRLISLLLTTIRINLPKWIVAGASILVSFLQGISQQMPRIVTAAVDVIVAFIHGVQANLPRIIQAGFDLIISFINGLANAIRSNSKAMGEAGGNLATAIIEGMVKGLGAGAGKVVEAAKNMAKNAFNAAKNFLGIGSPSKLFVELGQFTSEGMAIGIESYSDMVASSAENVGKEAILAMQKSISGLSDVLTQEDMALQPVITPVLDLSDVKKEASQIDTLLSTKPLTVSTTDKATKQVSASYREPTTALAQLAQAPGPTEVFSFVQNNTSPKALSSAEIYRQTKNQLSVAKGALST